MKNTGIDQIFFAAVYYPIFRDIDIANISVHKLSISKGDVFASEEVVVVGVVDVGVAVVTSAVGQLLFPLLSSPLRTQATNSWYSVIEPNKILFFIIDCSP